MKLLKTIVISIMLLWAFFACESTIDPKDLEDKAEVVDENVNSENAILRAFENVNNYGIGKKTKKENQLDGEPIQTWDGNTLMLDFSSVEGKSGNIVAVFSEQPDYKKYLNIYVQFIDYWDDGISISGAFKILIDDVKTDGSVVFKLWTEDDLSLKIEEQSFTLKCNQTVDWIEGMDTKNEFNDDAYLISGTLKQLKSDMLSHLTLNELFYANNCEYIKSGTVEIIVDGDDSATLCNFGVDAQGNESSGCNGYVQLSLDGISIIHDFKN